MRSNHVLVPLELITCSYVYTHTLLQMVEVINEDYQDYVNLSAKLAHVDGAVMRMRKPLLELKVRTPTHTRAHTHTHKLALTHTCTHARVHASEATRSSCQTLGWLAGAHTHTHTHTHTLARARA